VWLLTFLAGRATKTATASTEPPRRPTMTFVPGGSPLGTTAAPIAAAMRTTSVNGQTAPITTLDGSYD